MTAEGIAVREAVPADREFILATASRLGEFGAPPWRTPDEIVAGEVRTLRRHLSSPSPTAALLVAQDRSGQRLGFVFVESLRDYFRGESHGHVGILAVAGEAEGRGAGRALLGAAEDWARSRGYGFVTLNVFERNRRAREVYERAGYAPETLRYRKGL
jgi:GNAT superfamily N-acetyltransferase